MIVSSQANISDTPCDQKSPRPPEAGVLRRHKHKYRQTDRHMDIAVSRLNQPQVDSVKFI